MSLVLPGDEMMMRIDETESCTQGTNPAGKADRLYVETLESQISKLLLEPKWLSEIFAFL